MLITDLKGNKKPFNAYKDLYIEQEVNKLDILVFDIPAQYMSNFKNEYTVTTDNQSYIVKNIEPSGLNYTIECKQDISDWYTFNKSLNFPYKKISDVISGILPSGWQAVYLDDITENRTITADHKMSIDVIDELKSKYDVEIRFDNKAKKIIVGYEIAEDKGVYFTKDINLIDSDIKTETFEFATRIVPEGINGLKINQINDGKDYLENNSYSPKTITYYWKDERYTNIANLKDAAQKKLDELSQPYKSIELKVQDLSKAVEIRDPKFKTDNLEFNLGDYVYFLDKDNQTSEKFRILKLTKYPSRPFDTEVTLNNKPLDLVDDEQRMIELTSQMWEQTRVRFETTEDSIRGFVETQQRYTDDSFKTYKAEREMTDRRIYEAITESTTYVDPLTGQTKPIIDKQLEIDKTLDGINISLVNQEKANQEMIEANYDEIRETMRSKFFEMDSSISGVRGDVLAYKQAFDIANGEVNSEIISLRQEIDDSGNEIKKYMSENYSTRTQTDTMITDKIGSIRREMDSSDEALKRYVQENYSTRTQTEQAITDSVRSVQTKIDTSGNNIKKYVDENYSTRTQTDQMIQNEVGTIRTDVTRAKARADQAYSKTLQLDNEISAKVSYGDLSSEVRMLNNAISAKVGQAEVGLIVDNKMSNFKVRADQIDFVTTKARIQGIFQTESYGKRIYMSSNKIEFADSGNNLRGKIEIDDSNKVIFQGQGGYDNAYIEFNSTNTILTSNPTRGFLGGKWGVVDLEATGIHADVIKIKRQLDVGMIANLNGTTNINGPFNLYGDYEFRKSTNGSQLHIINTLYGSRFVIDFVNKTTHF